METGKDKKRQDKPNNVHVTVVNSLALQKTNTKPEAVHGITAKEDKIKDRNTPVCASTKLLKKGME